MKKQLIGFLIVGILMIGLLGCASVMPQIVKFDDQNAANTVAAAKQIMKHWGMNSAAIRQGLGSTLSEKLPASFGIAMDALDKYYVTYGKDQSGMTEPDAGRIDVLVGQLIDPLVITIINQYAPDVWSKVLKYLPSFITL
jgi:uncharacterized protein YceK